MNIKRCQDCKNDLPISDYYSKKRKSGTIYIDIVCKKCRQKRNNKIFENNPEKYIQKLEYVKQWHAEHPDRVLELKKAYRDKNPGRHREWYAENKDELNQRRRLKNIELRKEMIAAYGGKCECCGESTFEFLTIDHINGDGAAHRKQVSSNIVIELKKMGWPKDNYRLLCWNCNAGKAMYGYCHDKSEYSEPIRSKRVNQNLDPTTWYARNKEHTLEKHRQWVRNLREEMIAAYGGKCACCGEKRYELLTLEHINGDGGKIRKKMKSITEMTMLRKQGWPKGNHEILCWNCNVARHNYGVCPHNAG